MQNHLAFMTLTISLTTFNMYLHNCIILWKSKKYVLTLQVIIYRCLHLHGSIILYCVMWKYPSVEQLCDQDTLRNQEKPWAFSSSNRALYAVVDTSSSDKLNGLIVSFIWATRLPGIGHEGSSTTTSDVIRDRSGSGPSSSTPYNSSISSSLDLARKYATPVERWLLCRSMPATNNCSGDLPDSELSGCRLKAAVNLLRLLWIMGK